MQLISTLNSGLAAAANGWAEVYVRGTSTRATVFYDFEASASDSSGDNILLDAYGAVEVYVGQLVDIVAKSPDGTIVRSWTDGYAAPNIEVISPAFTGSDYVSGSIAVNEPTTLKDALDRWLDSGGAPDWGVEINGVDTPLTEAFGSLTGLVFNVKSPAYGAAGDGVTNDQSAIQAALADAVAAGGGTVFFPKGTYLVSTAIAWDHRVNMEGVNASLSIITTNSATNARLVTFTSGAALTSPVALTRMGFSSTQSNTGEQLYASVAVNLNLESCAFGVATTATGIAVNLTANNSTLVANRCKFLLNGGTNAAVQWVSTALTPTIVKLTSCSFATTQTAYAGSMVKIAGKTSITGCDFSISSLTSAGTRYAIECLSSDDELFATGCTFTTLAQAFTSPFKFNIGALVVAVGNEVPPSSLTATYTTAGLRDGSLLQLRSSSTSNTTTPSVPYGSFYHAHSSNTTVPTFTMPDGPYVGAELVLVLTNSSGGGWVGVGFTGATVQRVTTLAATDVPNAATVACNFRWRGTDWLLCHRD